MSHIVDKYIITFISRNTVALARNQGMTEWILVDSTMALQTEGKWNGNRVILASCESFRKQALVRDVNGTCSDGIAHGIASTQGRGKRCIASVLFSDIGPKFYQSLGWEPFPSYQLEFQAGEGQGAAATPLYAEDLAALCEEDEAGGSSPQNTLYILRLVVENRLPDAEALPETEKSLGAVLQAARAEAAEWGLHKVKLWSPSSTLEDMIKHTGVPYRAETRVHPSQYTMPTVVWRRGRETK
ncbi:hypothetical protein ARAM_001501 [Aspergillus rambellii]|uniref:LYC1 C-terminal domain-containing protein n=1 Tax=Aspergillus rambellii TaxID=308745 RepID=A0A0F8X5W6_9EURO|nr:hypothetical protein ARAM_001501 [Aspergillus rambellii]